VSDSDKAKVWRRLAVPIREDLPNGTRVHHKMTVGKVADLKTEAAALIG